MQSGQFKIINYNVAQGLPPASFAVSMVLQLPFAHFQMPRLPFFSRSVKENSMMNPRTATLGHRNTSSSCLRKWSDSGTSCSLK